MTIAAPLAIVWWLGLTPDHFWCPSLLAGSAGAASWFIVLFATGHPLWAPPGAYYPGFSGPAPETILGYPYIINNDVAVMGVSAKSILFGDFSNYFIRDALDVQVIRLNERFADNLQVGFIAFQRTDGNLINAGTNPVKYYQNSAT